MIQEEFYLFIFNDKLAVSETAAKTTGIKWPVDENNGLKEESVKIRW